MTTLSGFTGRVALVTGAGRNIGRAVALAMARAGADVGVCVRQNAAEGSAVVKEIMRNGAKATLTIGDVGEPAEARRVVEEVVKALGPVSYLIHCVAIRPRASIVDLRVEEWHRVMNTNCSSALYLAQAVLPGMADRGFGRIINFGGVDASRCGRNHAAIAISKAGVAALTKSISVEYGDKGVTANLIVPAMADTTREGNSPGWPPTPEHMASVLAVPRLGDPDEIAMACVFLASNEASYIIGQSLRVNGGFEM